MHHLRTLLLLLATSVVALPAQQLVANLRPTPLGGAGHGALVGPIVVGSQAFAAASTPWGQELMVTDGTLAGTRLVSDFNPLLLTGGEGGRPTEITPLGARVVFSAIARGVGRELWVSDGTSSGTTLLGDIRPGDESSDPTALVAFGGYVYFGAHDGTHGDELWVTDGTAAGTRLFVDLRPGSQSARPRPLVANGGLLYFQALSGQLWATDGTAAGTRMVFDQSSGIQGFGDATPLGSGILLRARVTGPSDIGTEPAFTDGTAAGTVVLGDLNPGMASSFPNGFTPVSGGGGTRALFVANTPATGAELWITDGTPGGTHLFAEIEPGATGSNPSELTEIGGTVYFRATTSAHGAEIWRADPVAGTVSLVVDLEPGPQGSDPAEFADIGGELWCSARTSAGNGGGLFRIDAAGVAHLEAGFRQPTQLRPLNGGVVCALDSSIGFVGGAYPNGTVLWAPLTPGDSTPRDLVPFGSGLLFHADAEGPGFEPVVTDGTLAGTTVLDTVPGSRGSSPTDGIAVNGRAVFGADDRLWSTDGTAAGTILLSNAGPATATLRSTFVAAGGRALYMAPVAAPGRELWVTDGTGAGTTQLLDLTSGLADTTMEAGVSLGARALVVLRSIANPSELWSSDGTVAGTFRVEPTPGQPINLVQDLVSDGSVAFFVANTPSGPVDLWVSDGTSAGTRPSGAFPGGLNVLEAVATSGRVFLVAQFSGQQHLVVSDGTAAGTAILLSSWGNLPVYSLTAAAGGAFFASDDGMHGQELWFADGTAAGPHMVLDIAPGPVSGISTDFMAPVFGGTRVAFVANDGVHGNQIWTSDGTAQGTVRASRFGAGGRGLAEIREVCSVGADLYASADDGLSGIELWRVNGVAGFVQAYGTGCTAAGRTEPVLSALGGAPAVGSTTFAVETSGAQPSGFAFLLLGSSAADGFLPGPCTRLIGLPVATHASAIASSAGVASFPLPIPNDPALAGYSAYLQAAVVQLGGPLEGVFALSNGLQVQIQL